MNYSPDISSLSPSINVEDVTNECICDKPKKQKKDIEEIKADNQLKEIFRRELKRDIFKLCREGKNWRDDRFPKIPESPRMKKKEHFLPPLKRRPVGSRFKPTKSFRLSDIMKLKSQSSAEKILEASKEESTHEIRDDDDDVDDDYDGDEDDYSIKKKRKGKSQPKGKDRTGKREGDKISVRSKGKGKGKGKDSDSQRTNVYSQSDSTFGGSKSIRTQDTSSNFSLGQERSLLEYGEDKSYYDIDKYSEQSDLLDKGTSYLLKYYQLKKIAAKLDERSLTTKNKKRKDNVAYKIGFAEGLKKAAEEPPIYENTMCKDYLTDDESEYEDFAFQDFGHKEEDSYNIYTIPKKKDKTKVIYVSTDQENVEELKQNYKEVEIRVVPKGRHFSSTAGKVIEKKVEDYIEFYKPMFTNKSSIYEEAFREGFVDGFNQTFIYRPSDSSFNDEEKLYVNEVRKCLLNEDYIDSIDNDDIDGIDATNAIGTINAIDGIDATDAIGTINAMGAIDATNAVGTIDAIGTIGTVSTIGTVGTIGKTGTVGTIGKTGTVGTIGKTGTVGTIGKTGTVGTIGKTGTVGTIGKTGTIGTINTTRAINTIDAAGAISALKTSDAIGAIDAIGTIDAVGAIGALNTTDAIDDKGKKMKDNDNKETIDDSYIKKALLIYSTNALKQALLDRAKNLKAAIKNVDFDAYEKEIESFNLKRPLRFTKSDFIFFYNYGKEKKKRRKRAQDKKQPKRKHRRKVLQTDSSSSSSSSSSSIGKTNLQLRRKVKTDDRAWDYLTNHNIGELFRYMGIMLCSYKPDDPIDFLIKLLDKCLLFRGDESHNKAPLVFTEKHVESIYSNMDPLNYGYIDGKQYLYGLNLLEVTEPDDIALVQNTDTVDKNQFLINANDRLLEKFRVMIAIC